MTNYVNDQLGLIKIKGKDYYKYFVPGTKMVLTLPSKITTGAKYLNRSRLGRKSYLYTSKKTNQFKLYNIAETKRQSE